MVKLTRMSKYIVIVLAVLVVLELTQSGLRLMSIGSYTTAYEGAKARYYGVSYDNKDTKVTGVTGLSWDPDGYAYGKPALAGEETAVFIPSESIGQQVSKFSKTGADISSWLVQDTKIKNPVASYQWDLQDEVTGEVDSYTLEEWSCRWYFSISSEPKDSELQFYRLGPQLVVVRNSLSNAQVWFEIDVAPIWYFENQSMSYFAVAELKVTDIQIGGKVSDGYKAESNSECRVTPSSQNSILPIFHNPFGAESDRAETTVYNYKGKKLNPDYFAPKVYTFFGLDDFGVTSWWAMGNHYRADVVTVGVDVRLFVVGEWKVKDVQDLPDEYGRTAKWSSVDIFGGLFSGPSGSLLIMAIVIVAVFLILSIFAPWVLLGLFQLMGSGKRRR
jgi:hypothetical protein